MSIFLEPFLDRRPPTPDVKGALADLQVRSSQLEELAKELSTSWPQVSSVYCGFRDAIPCFVIHINPFSYKNRENHRVLHNRIRYLFELDKLETYILPEAKSKPPYYLLGIYGKN